MAFTEDQKKEIQGMFVEAIKGEAFREILGGAIEPLKIEMSKQISGVSAKLSKSLKETEDKVTGLTSEEGRAALIKELAAAGGVADPNKDPAKGGDKGEPKPDPETIKLRTRLETLEKERATEREQAKAEKEASQRALDQAAIEKALGAHVDKNPDIITAARLLLTDGKKLVVRGEDGNLVFKMPRKAGKENYVEDMSLDDGIAEWAKTESAKHFLPPKDVSGSGDPNKGTPPRGGGNGFEANRAAFFADPALR